MAHCCQNVFYPVFKMKHIFLFLLVAGMVWPSGSTAQQHVAIMSRCGGVDTVIIPNIIDRDSDGMDDRLEQKLLDRFMPVIIMFSDENCPGPALDGTGDSNLIACRISPYPGQYTRSGSLDSVMIHPVPMVAAKHLVPGLIWYNTFIMVHCAVLYGQDCGALGHTADVEGFHFSLKYIGPDTLAGWMYDTVMTNWMGATIQSISHDGTLCQHIETRPYKSALVPTGVDTVYSSPNKHGNYLTIGDCNSSFICNPGCNNTQIAKPMINVNLGEPWATLVTDMGNLYPAYAGNNPWGSTNFLNGGAGTIAAKMERALTSDFAVGQTLTAPQICPIYQVCYGPSGSAYSDYTCTPNSYTFFSQHLTAPGTYTHTVTNSYGCDSVISLTLAVYSPTSYAFNDYTCQGIPYAFNGRQLTAAGVYNDTLTNANGCDSAVALTLSVVPPVSYTVTDSFCTGSRYNFNGHAITAAGQYNDTLVSGNGCLSYVTLNLSAMALPAVSWGNSADTIILGSSAMVLNGGQPTGGSYSGEGVSGNSFYPDSAGVGAHVVTYTYADSSGCTNSATKTFVVGVSGINEVAVAGQIQFYPNPANDVLTLQSELFSNATILPVVYDLTGKSIPVTFQKQGNRILLNTGALSVGMYWVKLEVAGMVVCKKFVRE